jgi:hypothetical protein
MSVGIITAVLLYVILLHYLIKDFVLALSDINPYFYIYTVHIVVLFQSLVGVRSQAQHVKY